MTLKFDFQQNEVSFFFFLSHLSALSCIGWNYYGERACIYLFGNKGVLPYRLIFIALIASGAFLKLEAIWILADIVNGLMAIPNLIALIALSGVIVAETNKYMNRHKKTARSSAEK